MVHRYKCPIRILAIELLDRVVASLVDPIIQDEFVAASKAAKLVAPQQEKRV